ncbi:hypothetical protein BJ912DRAFT_533936 [Pholiota molesta]|nr:hypothetical protein BJ912DRAFT_533936 [Pholiota molesta]
MMTTRRLLRAWTTPVPAVATMFSPPSILLDSAAQEWQMGTHSARHGPALPARSTTRNPLETVRKTTRTLRVVLDQDAKGSGGRLAGNLEPAAPMVGSEQLKWKRLQKEQAANVFRLRSALAEADPLSMTHSCAANMLPPMEHTQNTPL